MGGIVPKSPTELFGMDWIGVGLIVWKKENRSGKW
jgi:hypothetical protein